MTTQPRKQPDINSCFRTGMDLCVSFDLLEFNTRQVQLRNMKTAPEKTLDAFAVTDVVKEILNLLETAEACGAIYFDKQKLLKDYQAFQEVLKRRNDPMQNIHGGATGELHNALVDLRFHAFDYQLMRKKP
mgnify:CR=1 FL=1